MKIKVSPSLIVGMVLIGAVLLVSLAVLAKANALTPTLFLGFFALIIVLQVIPAVMLFGVLLREVFRPAPREKEEAGARSSHEG